MQVFPHYVAQMYREWHSSNRFQFFVSSGSSYVLDINSVLWYQSYKPPIKGLLKSGAYRTGSLNNKFNSFENRLQLEDGEDF